MKELQEKFKTQRGITLGADTGIGKTIIALTVSQSIVMGKTLFIVPKSAKVTWNDEFELHMPNFKLNKRGDSHKANARENELKDF